jgi:subfamily B ATP-binding cassette protein MsbA
MPRDMNKPAALPKDHTASLVWRLARTYLRPYLRELVISLLFMVLAGAMTALIAKLMQPVLDDVLYAKKADLIIPLAGAIIVTFFVRGFSTYGHIVVMNKIGQNIIADIQRDLFSRFMIFDLSFFHANPSGQLVSRIVNDVNIMRMAITDTLTGFGKSLLTLIFLVAVMVHQDWKLSLAAFAVFPFAAIFVAKLGRKLRQVSYGIQDNLASLSDVLSQVFQGIRQVKAYGMEDFERTRASRSIVAVTKLNMKAARVSNMSTPFNELLVGLAFAGIIVYGGRQVVDDGMTAGQLVSFLAAFGLAYEPMKKLAKLNATLQVGLGATERVFDMLDRKPSITTKANATTLASRNPEITFDKVQFSYEESDLKALDKISFTAKPGTVTALVGPSGGGKTTVINLIPRFYDVQGGTISIDGNDVRDLTIESLRAHIALVSQDITIFDDTIAANIAYGKPGASTEEIRAAAAAAAADEFISAFPDGYESRAGENGVKLSGGQRQRIAIARAILRDAPILLLDEATSALDNESEKAIQGALEKLEKGRTTIVIAHRLSTVQSADKIIVLDQGRIAEEGSHSALIGAGGLYAQMHRAGLRDQ